LSSPAKAGDPVRRGLSVQAPAPLEYWIARSRLRQGFAGPRTHSAAEALAKAASRAMTTKRSHIFRFRISNNARVSARIPAAWFARVLPLRCPSEPQRAQGKPGADCARSTVCESSERMHTDLTGTAETSRLSPRNGLTAYTCSPRGAAFLAPVAGGKPADVAPGSRRQDHTTSPAAANVSSGEDHLTPTSGPSQPAPRSVTIARTSLMVARAGAS
jgi:hypothetical protein